MRISDWSSDVCSSDLRRDHRVGDRHGAQGPLIPFGAGVDDAMIEMGTKRGEPAKEIADIRSRLDHLQSRIGGEDGDAGAIGQVEPRLGIEQISREPPGPRAREPPGGTHFRREVEKGDAEAGSTAWRENGVRTVGSPW